MKNTNKNSNENTNLENGIFRNDCKRGDGIDNSFEISYTEHDGLLYPDFVLPNKRSDKHSRPIVKSRVAFVMIDLSFV